MTACMRLRRISLVSIQAVVGEWAGFHEPPLCSCDLPSCCGLKQPAAAKAGEERMGSYQNFTLMPNLTIRPREIFAAKPYAGPKVELRL